jgi:hypothetical protein
MGDIHYENMWYDLEWIYWQYNTKKYSVNVVINV